MADGKRILLCAAGLSPQIVTETLWALAVREGLFVPDEVHIVTTQTGRKIALERLLNPQDGRFHSLCREYGLEGRVRMDASTIHVIARDGEPLEDIRDIPDNTAAAAYLFALVRELVGQCDCLHASIAGGRKTMGFYLGAAMQFYARERDELSHVLVASPFESHPDFFYPPRAPRDFSFQDRRTGSWLTLSSSEALIDLARMPFVRLRDFLPETLPATLPVEALVAAAQQNLEASEQPSEVVWVPGTCSVRMGTDVVQLSGVEAAVYETFLNARLACGKSECDGCMECYLAPEDIGWESLLDMVERHYGRNSGRYEALEERWRKENEPGTGVRRDWLRQQITAIKKKFRVFPYARLAEIQSLRRYSNTRYGLDTGRTAFRIVEDDDA